MKRTLPILFLLNFTTMLLAQSDDLMVTPYLPQPSLLPKLIEMEAPPSAPAEFRDEQEVRIGMTRFEVQTISSLGRRVAVAPNGQISAAWLHGLNQNGGWPDRGTAYNQRGASAWGPEPDFSLEQTRSGYPSFTSTINGLEVVISHKNTTDSTWFLQAHTKMPNETTWTETAIPSNVKGGPVWAKVATGGPDGNTIHVVAVSVLSDFGGITYEGMDQHPLYYRSLDGGATWDKFDVIIPGLDSNFYSVVRGEAYNIHANGETVAIGVFDAWGDIAIFKSTDNGDTWAKTIVKDHPLDKYDDSGYGPGDVPFDPNVPDSISIFSSDYSGSLLVDDNGKVHVFYGAMYVYATDAGRFLNVQFTDGSLVFDGIAYWNEDYATDQVDIIASAPDMDGDGVVTVSDYDDIRYNNANFTGFPTASIDDDGNIYVVYTSMREDLSSFEETTYRHVFIVKSADGGVSWTEPFDLINPDVTEFYEFIEGAYPSMPERIGTQIDLIYMQDFEPGLTPQNTMIAEQVIMHVTYDKNTFEPSSTTEIEQLTGEVVLTPNPAVETTTLRFELNEPADVVFRIFDGLGKQVYFGKRENLLAGLHRVTVNISGLANGLYFVQLQIGGAQMSKKLVISE